jgi:uncharacterized protein YceK
MRTIITILAVSLLSGCATAVQQQAAPIQPVSAEITTKPGGVSSTWTFLTTLSMPSFGGRVLIRSELADEAACHKFRKVAIGRLVDMRSNATVGECKADTDVVVAAPTK